MKSQKEQKALTQTSECSGETGIYFILNFKYHQQFWTKLNFSGKYLHHGLLHFVGTCWLENLLFCSSEIDKMLPVASKEEFSFKCFVCL